MEKRPSYFFLIGKQQGVFVCARGAEDPSEKKKVSNENLHHQMIFLSKN